jgi:succinoglycan biosynthesis transport protein ExoP
MQHDLTEKQDGPVGPIRFASMDDPTGRLEPLAVPLGRLKSILRRHFRIVLLTFVLGVGGTAVFVKHMPKQYTAEAAILIEPQRTQVSDLQAISPDTGDVSGLVRTQIDILRSPALVRGVVEGQHLIDVPEFEPKGGGLMFLAMGLLQKCGLIPTPEVLPPTQQELVEIATAVLGTKIGFANEIRSSVLNVMVTTEDRGLSARIANEIAKHYLDFKRQEKFAAMQKAHDWFQEQIGTLADQLRAANTAVEQYRQQHRLDEEPPTDDPGNTARTPTINRQQLDTISRELVGISRERARKEAQLAQAQAAMRGETQASTLPEVLVSPVIGQLLAQTAVIAGREAQLAAAQGAGNPELAAVRAQLRKLQLRTEQEMANVASSLGTEVKTARAQEQALQRQMEQLRGAVSGENSAQVGLQALQTQARATRTIYESFLTRATQLANVAGIQEPDASLVSAAQPPLGPSAPRSTRLLGVAAVLSLVIGVALTCVIERLRDGFSLPEQLEATLGLPLIAIVPNVSSKALQKPRKGKGAIAFNASIDKLRGQMRALGEGRPKLVMVTSALPKDGKSFFAASFARNAAAAGWRVLLVDCDFGCPVLSKTFHLPSAPGLSEILAGDLLGDSWSVMHEPAPRLNVITAGHTGLDPQEQLASRSMASFLIAVRKRYDLVVLDTPPVLPVADALVLAPQVDATLMVVRWEKTPRTAARDALRLLNESRAHVIGAIMTRVDRRTAAISTGRMSFAFSHYEGYHATRASWS